ncbi:hypothetical protein GYMLUDRAFT_61823 [Collybiopsis luxurians FD-317 M1]|uniref:Uncharacterized protein n=1 Tax=Collybiopsis luxurians FD-317 M1 TaxID=944289 RepID=A0A0D0B130_9AGAR|nr:hypothetical protein GYMLUDRAFT_61823 [Collybiopsis luxurians FD-317 M1]
MDSCIWILNSQDYVTQEVTYELNQCWMARRSFAKSVGSMPRFKTVYLAPNVSRPFIQRLPLLLDSNGDLLHQFLAEIILLLFGMQLAPTATIEKWELSVWPTGNLNSYVVFGLNAMHNKLHLPLCTALDDNCARTDNNAFWGCNIIGVACTEEGKSQHAWNSDINLLRNHLQG